MDDLFDIGNIIGECRVNEDVSFFVQPQTAYVTKVLADAGVIQKMLAAGVEITPPSCDACVGIGHVPACGINSLRTISRNFLGRSGCDYDSVYLCSAQTAAASAVTGKITDPREFATHYGVRHSTLKVPERSVHTENWMIPPLPPEHASTPVKPEKATVSCGTGRLLDSVFSRVALKLGDNISTDQIMPYGADIKAARTDTGQMAKYIFYRMDKEISQRFADKKPKIIVAGENFGQGSAREYAAMVLAYLGVQCIIAISYSSNYLNNIINYGLLPLDFTNRADYTLIEEGDTLQIKNILSGIRSGTFDVNDSTKGISFSAAVHITPYQKKILCAGGFINYVRTAAGYRDFR